MKTGFIGAGKVGFTLGKCFVDRGNEVIGYYSHNTRSAEEAAAFTGTFAYKSLEKLVEDCDVLFLTVPDGAISEVFEEVRRYPIQGKIICHCSGALTSREAFPCIDNTGSYGISVHPLFAVSDKYNAYRELADVFFVLEGDERSLMQIGEWLRSMDLKVRTIQPSAKTRYHAAAAIASNLVIGLLAQSVDMLKDCGFTESEAMEALGPLAMENVKHVFEGGSLVDSLTGPVERGDGKTIAKHLQVLQTAEEKQLYALLSKNLVQLASKKHPERTYESINNMLSLDVLEENK